MTDRLIDGPADPADDPAPLSQHLLIIPLLRSQPSVIPRRT